MRRRRAAGPEQQTQRPVVGHQPDPRRGEFVVIRRPSPGPVEVNLVGVLDAGIEALEADDREVMTLHLERVGNLPNTATRHAWSVSTQIVASVRPT